MDNKLDDITLEALKKLTAGMVVTEITKEFIAGENGELKLVKQKVNKKTIPPSTDIVKLVYLAKKEQVSPYKTMTDEELEREKRRLLTELKNEGEENENRKTN